MRRAIMVLALAAAAAAGCEAANGGCRCPETRMEDLDFFGVYFSPCVEYVNDLQALYVHCGDYDTVPDVDTCVWHLWNEYGAGKGACVSRIVEIAEARRDPLVCERIRPNLALCEYGL